MIKTPIKVQDLKRRIYLEAKAEVLAGRGGVGRGYTATGRKPLRYHRSHNP